MGKFNKPKIPLNLKLAKVSLLNIIAIIQYLWKIIFGPRRMTFMGENLVLKLKFCKFEVHYVNLQKQILYLQIKNSITHLTIISTDPMLWYGHSNQAKGPSTQMKLF